MFRWKQLEDIFLDAIFLSIFFQSDENNFIIVLLFDKK